MRLLLDANILLDDVLNRSGRIGSRALISLCGTHHDAWVAWHTLSNLYYIVRKHPGQHANALQMIRDLLSWCEVAGATRAAALKATQMGITDFEDALQVVAAEMCGADSIITRNTIDFRNSPIPALTPEDFLAQYHPNFVP